MSDIDIDALGMALCDHDWMRRIRTSGATVTFDYICSKRGAEGEEEDR